MTDLERTNAAASIFAFIPACEYPQTRSVYLSEVSLTIVLVNRTINTVRITCKRIVPERGRCSATRSGRRPGRYQVYSGAPAEVGEEIRQLRARVAIVLQRAEIALRTLAA
jgi:hypothetical protein